MTEKPALQTTTSFPDQETKDFATPCRGSLIILWMEVWRQEQSTLPEDTPLESSIGPPGPQRPPVVLVVEDESFQALALQRLLRRLGYETPDHAVTGAEAIEKAAEYCPDLILMDIRLRGSMDGITAAGRIQRQIDVPVIYLTAYTDAATVRRAQETKYFAFLEKPVDDGTLRTTIETALRRHRAEREGREPGNTE